MSDGMRLTTGVGRIVWGHPGKPQVKKDMQTKQPVLKDGKPVEQWVFGVAFPKPEFERDIWPTMAKEAATGYPNGVPQNFSWKYDDGDGVDSQGKPYNQREGYAGCYVLTVSTEAFAPPIFKRNPQTGGYDQIPAEAIKTGDYVSLGLNFKVNVPANRAHTPSLYVNPLAIEFVGYGSEIQRGANPDELFGGRQHQLPPGASQTPVMSGSGGMPGMSPQQPQQPMQQPAPMQPAQMPGMLPGGHAPMAPQGMPGYPQQQQPQQPAPMQQPQYAPQPGMMPPPAPDFTQNAGYQQQPQGMPGYPQQPAPMQQPQYAPQPGQMPGQMPGR